MLSSHRRIAPTSRRRREKLAACAASVALAAACVVACASKPPADVAPRAAIANPAPDDGSAALQVHACSAVASARARADAGDSGAAENAASDVAPPETRKRTHASRDTCETADDNLAVAASEVRAHIGQLAPAPSAPWNKRTPPRYLGAIEARLSLSAAEKAKIAENGFVVLPRTAQASYAWAMHEVHQSELPVFVSMDAILFAVYASNDKLLAALEEYSLRAKLDAALETMHCALAQRYADYPADVARDVDLYLTVARSLLAERAVPSVLGADDEAAKLVALATAAKGATILSIFGRDRYVDFSQYMPRGHYATLAPDYPGAEAAPSPLAGYFRAGMWLSRMELNLSSRGSRSSDPGAGPNPEETPREENVALALADLAERSGALAGARAVTSAWNVLAGRREDVSLEDLVALRKKAGIARVDADAPAALRSAIGSDFQRTARFHRMPEGTRVLPAIFTLLGPRVTPDAPAFVPLVNAQIAGRAMVSAGDVGAILGKDSAREYLAADLAKYPGLAAGLEKAKSIVANARDDNSLYYAWFSAVRGLAEPAQESAPSFMRTRAYDDFALGSVIAGYGELRHNYVLMAGQPYDEGGCDIPDGYVEPKPRTLDALLTYAARGKDVARALDPRDTLGGATYFGNLEATLSVLRVIVDDELAGRPLSAAEKRYLSMVAEMTPGSTGGPPTYTGFYFDMFRAREAEALTPPAFIADYYTSSEAGRVAYLGVRAPVMGVFVVDRGGAPRAFVGPVADAYEATGPLEKRLSDATAADAEHVSAPWKRRITAPPAEPVPIVMVASLGDYERPERLASAFVQSTKNLANVKVSLLDHHRRVLAEITKSVPAGKRVDYKFAIPGSRAEGARVTVDEFSLEGFRTTMDYGISISAGGMGQTPEGTPP